MVNQTCFTITYTTTNRLYARTVHFHLGSYKSVQLFQHVELVARKKKQPATTDNERLQLKWLVRIAETLKNKQQRGGDLLTRTRNVLFMAYTALLIWVLANYVYKNIVVFIILFVSRDSIDFNRLLYLQTAEKSKNINERCMYSCTNTIADMGKHTHIHIGNRQSAYIWIRNVLTVHLYNFSKRRNSVSINN